MSKWKCCKTEPPETGKKILCQQKGDLYVAIRLGEHYIPMPFADHYFSPDLSKPETWSEIDFPPHLTGHTKAVHEDNPTILLTLAEFEIAHPEEFKYFTDMMIGSLGKLKNPNIKKRNKNGRN